MRTVPYSHPRRKHRFFWLLLALYIRLSIHISTKTQMCIDYTIVPRASLGREGLCSAIPPVMAARVKYGIGKELAWTNGNKQRAMPSARTCKKSIKLLRFWKYACSSNVSGIIRFIEGHFLVYEVNLQRNYALLSWTNQIRAHKNEEKKTPSRLHTNLARGTWSRSSQKVR